MTEDELARFRIDNGHHPKRRYVLGQDGLPVKNRFGEYLTPNLTEEDFQEIARLWALGMSTTEIVAETGITRGRIDKAKKELTVIEAATQMRVTEAIPEILKAQQGMTDAIAVLSEELKGLRYEVRRLAYHSQYRSLNLHKTRRREASLKEEVSALKKAYWKATGRKP